MDTKIHIPSKSFIIQTDVGVFDIPDYSSMNANEIRRIKDDYVIKFEYLRNNYNTQGIDVETPKEREDINLMAVRYAEAKILLGI